MSNTDCFPGKSRWQPQRNDRRPSGRAGFFLNPVDAFFTKQMKGNNNGTAECKPLPPVSNFQMEEKMDSRQDILRRLQQSLADQLGIPQERITEESTWAQMGADSLDRLETSRVIEDAFKVYIPHQVGEKLNTVGETVDHLIAVMEEQLITSDIPNGLTA
jgi:acyl carrier protein